jgi:hypothetical protein
LMRCCTPPEMADRDLNGFDISENGRRVATVFLAFRVPPATRFCYPPARPIPDTHP